MIRMLSAGIIKKDQETESGNVQLTGFAVFNLTGARRRDENRIW